MSTRLLTAAALAALLAGCNNPPLLDRLPAGGGGDTGGGDTGGGDSGGDTGGGGDSGGDTGGGDTGGGTTDPPPVEPPPDPATTPPAWPPLQEGIEGLRIDFPASTAAIVYELWSKEYAPGELFLAGAWHDVELRQRGDGAREHPKHSWKTRHPSGVAMSGAPGTGSWYARTRNYLAEWADGGYLADPFSYGLMRGAGVRAPRWRFVTLEVERVHQGLYVELQEADDKHFLRSQGFHENSNTYRCGLRDCELKLAPPRSYQGPWEKETNELGSDEDLWTFLRGLARTPEHELQAWLERNVELDQLVRMYAVAILVSWSGIDDSGSYLVHDAATGKWTFVPWDLNNAKIVYWRDNDPSWSAPSRYAIPTYTLYDAATLAIAAGKSARYDVDAHPPFVVLFQRMWDLPALRNRVLDEVEAMLDGVFSEDAAGARIQAIHALIRAELARDPWTSDGGVLTEHAANAPAWLQEYVRNRTGFLRQQIPLERRRGEGGLVVNAVGPGFVELHNREDTARDLRGLTITDDLRARLKQALPSGTVVPARGTITLPFATAADGGEVGIFDAATRMPLDAVFYAPLAGRTYARTPEGAETWGWR
jgi:spore coat protein H